MSKALLLLTLLVISFCAADTAQAEDLDGDAKVISSFLIELIEKYDVSGTGAIPVEKYPSFLSDVFLTGNSVSQNVDVGDEAKQLLLEATTGFTAKYNGTEVGIQDFYMGLVKDFTIYLTQHEERYEKIIEIFFSDTPSSAEQPKQASQKVQQAVEL